MLSVCAEAQNGVQYLHKDSTKVMQIMGKVGKMDEKQDTILFIARQLRGIPYVAQTLEKNKKERLIVNLRQLDCTTYVENVLAIYLCCKHHTINFSDFCHNLRNIRYGGGQVDYASRLHYFSQWIDSNARAGMVKEVQSPTPPFDNEQVLDIHFMSEHHTKYPMLANDTKLIERIKENEGKISGKHIKYIPKTGLDDGTLLRQTILNGDILAIVTNKDGLDISHIGIAVWHDDGLHLLNASQIHKKVVEESLTLSAYMNKHPSQVGIRVIHIL